MFLLIDAGNTRIKIFLYNRISKQIDGYIIDDKEKLETELIKISQTVKIDEVLLVSVIPSINEVIKNIFDQTLIFNYEYFQKFLDFGDLDYQEMGNDRVVCLCAAQAKYGSNLIVFDLGTALKVEVVKANRYVSGYIYPGLDLIKNALVKNAEQLNAFEFGKVTFDNKCVDTYSQLNDGILYGMMGTINQFLQLAKTHFEIEDYQVIITGGGCIHLTNGIEDFAQKLNVIVDNNLMRDGLVQIGEELFNEKRDN